MKPLLTFLAVILSLSLYSQTPDRFKNFHGLMAPGDGGHFFEAEGYDIFIQTLNYALDEKDISKIRKKYAAKDAVLATDSVLNVKYLSGSKDHDGILARFGYYLIPANSEATTIIGFVRPNSRDLGLERFFVQAYIDTTIPDYVYTDIGISTIDFAGRKIKLGPICHWTGPHNIQCPDRGQMNWAIFDNPEQAEEYRDIRLKMAKSKAITDVKEEKWITLKFEGQETKALKTKIKVNLPKFVMAGSNVLVAYYVTGYVRGKYVTCVLSHYTDDIGADKLPPLLAEVLELIE